VVLHLARLTAKAVQAFDILISSKFKSFKSTQAFLFVCYGLYFSSSLVIAATAGVEVSPRCRKLQGIITYYSTLWHRWIHAVHAAVTFVWRKDHFRA
jgi:hypothetical protein